ncbi:cation:proton antiporter [Corynebacterium jeddahense]|uniref:Monovalent cation/H+ antiporter subunit F n=1 Tax=Corynebacterium jeddahense TaxID=1414719 RepID=A0ABY7UHP6_9CORY|nr:cation:proton antiporter [Corynebacterium jeddahense]WCZ37783.1 putative monovalent cation/H+ antiporter subunit F [Corynebacterium jeddahense]
MFTTLMQACMIIMSVSLLVALGAVILTKDELSRAVMADVIFYGMVCIYLVWTLWHSTTIGYEIPILAGLVCGVIPTISMARIISRGRR